MQIINFTAKEILPKLLNKEKQQTIRPAFKLIDNKIIPKPVRFKVQDKVKLMWKQRSPYDEFCSVCGNSIKKPPGRAIYCDTENCPEFGRATNTFNKILGTGTITEVFVVEMAKIEARYRVTKNNYVHYALNNHNYTNNDFINDLARRDGFNSAKEMLYWFHNYYNLIIPRPFRIFRWRWDE